MNKNKIHIIVDDVERRIIINALCHLQQETKERGQEHQILNDLIVRVCDAQPKKSKFKLSHEAR